MSENKVSIVTLTFNHWNLCHSLLYDIHSYNRFGLDELVIVDNGSTDKDVHDGLLWWMDNKMLPIQLIRINHNIGFLKAANLGVEKSTGDIIILVSNDVQIKKPIIQQIIDTVSHQKAVVGGRLLDYDTGWNQFSGKIYKYLEGWLLGFTRKSWEDVHGFDERYAPNDYEDVDVSTSWIAKGYSLVQLETTGTNHLGAQTIQYSPEREKITKINREKFREKWTLG